MTENEHVAVAPLNSAVTVTGKRTVDRTPTSKLYPAGAFELSTAVTSSLPNRVLTSSKKSTWALVVSVAATTSLSVGQKTSVDAKYGSYVGTYKAGSQQDEIDGQVGSSSVLVGDTGTRAAQLQH